MWPQDECSPVLHVQLLRNVLVLPVAETGGSVELAGSGWRLCGPGSPCSCSETCPPESVAPFLLHPQGNIWIQTHSISSKVENSNTDTVHLYIEWYTMRTTMRTMILTQTHSAFLWPCPPRSAGGATSSGCIPYESRRLRTYGESSIHATLWPQIRGAVTRNIPGRDTGQNWWKSYLIMPLPKLVTILSKASSRGFSEPFWLTWWRDEI